MGRVILNGFLLIALIASVAATWLMSPDPAQPNLEFLPQMVHSPRYNAFSPNPNFADGTTLQHPEPGTIARGSKPLHYAATPQDALRAGEELHSPLVRASARASGIGERLCSLISVRFATALAEQGMDRWRNAGIRHRLLFWPNMRRK